MSLAHFHKYYPQSSCPTWESAAASTEMSSTVSNIVKKEKCKFPCVCISKETLGFLKSIFSSSQTPRPPQTLPPAGTSLLPGDGLWLSPWEPSEGHRVGGVCCDAFLSLLFSFQLNSFVQNSLHLLIRYWLFDESVSCMLCERGGRILHAILKRIFVASWKNSSFFLTGIRCT